MNIIKDGNIINVTEKAYNVIYKGQGYVPYNSDNLGRKVEKDEEIKYEDITKNEIIEKLEENKIEHTKSSSKKELFELLGSE